MKIEQPFEIPEPSYPRWAIYLVSVAMSAGLGLVLMLAVNPLWGLHEGFWGWFLVAVLGTAIVRVGIWAEDASNGKL